MPWSTCSFVLRMYLHYSQMISMNLKKKKSMKNLYFLTYLKTFYLINFLLTFIRCVTVITTGQDLSKEDALLERHSITCKLCHTKFDSLGDMQMHVLVEHMQKGDYQIPEEEEDK